MINEFPHFLRLNRLLTVLKIDWQIIGAERWYLYSIWSILCIYRVEQDGNVMFNQLVGIEGDKSKKKRKKEKTIGMCHIMATNIDS